LITFSILSSVSCLVRIFLRTAPGLISNKVRIRFEE
jgi:hypothetical protein